MPLLRVSATFTLLLTLTASTASSLAAASSSSNTRGPEHRTLLPTEDGWRAISTTLMDRDATGTFQIAIGEIADPGTPRLRIRRGSIGSTCYPAPRPSDSESHSTIPLAIRPDFLKAVDLNADGRLDLLVGQRGAPSLVWYAAPFSETTRPTGVLELPGPLRLLEVADIDRRDGFDDVLVAVEGNHGTDLLQVYHSPLGDPLAQPDTIHLPSPITAVSWGRFDNSGSPPAVDLQIDAGGERWLAAGRWNASRASFSDETFEHRPVQLLATDQAAAATDRASFSDETFPTLRIRTDGAVELIDRQSTATFRVNSLFDGADGDPDDGICDTSTTPDPSGICTLRAAVEQANESAGPDAIEFAFAGAGPFELAVIGPDAIEITEAVTLDGTSHLSFIGTPLIELAFSGGGVIPGLAISGDDVLVCGLSITGFPTEGISITGDRTILEGNLIGVDPTLTAAGNLRGVASSGDDGRIGSTGAGNLISGNTVGGIALGATANDNEVFNNRIGTDLAGRVPMSNGGPGIRVDGDANDIGGTGFSEGNLISANAIIGLWLTGDNNLVQGNVIGLDSSRSARLGNRFAGVFIDDGADSNLIGGVSRAATNLIAANIADAAGFGGSGIVIRGAIDTVVEGNWIGGAGGLGNDLHGIHVEKVSELIPSIGTIGGRDSRANVIIGNGAGVDGGHGILLEGAEDFRIYGNRIGIGFLGFPALGNNGDGLRIVESRDTLVGGTAPAGALNYIAYNTGNGIGIHDLDSSAGMQNTLGNRLTRNILGHNGALGIDLTRGSPVADGPTANDDDDPDFGPNRLQNFPTIDSVTRTGGMTTISGDLSAAPSTSFLIELFDSPACDPSGFGEAHAYLDAVGVTTNGAGEATFAFMTPNFVTVPTATATNLTTLDTSELSPCPAGSPGGGNGILGDRVWLDLDGDGRQALGEPGVAGVTVRLLDDVSGVEVDSEVTDANGIYRFVDVASGSYRIEVEPVPGATFSPLDLGSDDTLDSDVDPLTGITASFPYTAGSVDLTRDAGLDVPLFTDSFETGDTSRWN